MLQGLAVPVGVVVVAVVVTAVTDLWQFKIHNFLTLPLLASGLLYHGLVGGLPGLGNSALGLLFGFGVLVVFYLLGGMGGGDVKLFAAVGAWLGMPLIFYVFLASSLAAGVCAVGMILLYHRVGETCVNLQILWLRLRTFARYLVAEDRVESVAQAPDRRRRLIPFAVMVAFGTIATLILAWLGRLP